MVPSVPTNAEWTIVGTIAIRQQIKSENINARPQNSASIAD
jgi:hypothetical protein